MTDFDVGDLAAVEATGISVRFGKTRALDGANLSVRRGEVHGLIGRNGAGKSTLVSVISGLLQPNSGEVRFSGAVAPKAGHVGAWRKQIGTVFQKPMIARELSVLENLFLGAPLLRRGGVVDWRAMRARATAALQEWGVQVKLGAPAGDLTIGEQQLLEILRIMMLGPKVIVLDEPTAKLGRVEATVLIEHIHRLRSRGISFVYVSHHLDEVLEVCDSVTVVRNGRNVWTRPASEITISHLTEAMSGGAVSIAGVIDGSSRASGERERVVLRLDNLVSDMFKDISFSVRTGECVGLAGLKGSGNQDVGKVLAGLSGVSSGRIEIDGRPVRPTKVRTMLDAGVGYVSGDRHVDGFVAELSISDNLSMAVLPRVSRVGVVDGTRRAEMVSSIATKLDVVASSPSQHVASLSGGNQQKVVLGRAIASTPKVLVLDNPTAGVDIASRESLFGVVADACASGTAALVISDDEEELKRCGRILIMVKGRLSKELAGGCADSAIVAAMSEGN